jgi:ribosomal protein L34E
MPANDELCRQHAERLAKLEEHCGACGKSLGRIEAKLDASFTRTAKIEQDLHLAKWLGGIATALGLTAIGAWINKMVG